MSEDNFTAEDLQELDALKDLDQVKQRAIELISAESDRPMKPEKIQWLTGQINSKKSKLAIVKLMWDLLLAGDGMSVVGSKNSTKKNSYREKFS